VEGIKALHNLNPDISSRNHGAAKLRRCRRMQ
jgi:hypothetical protein